MSVSGRMIWRTPIIDGNQRYSWTKTRRSLLVSRALPRHVRPSTISCWRRTAFSASSRAVDLNGETNRAKANHRSPITRSAYAIRPPPQWNEVFGTHRRRPRPLLRAKLPKRAQPVFHVESLIDLPVANCLNIDRHDSETLARVRSTEQLACRRAGYLSANDHTIAGDEHLLDVKLHVGDRI